MLAPIELLRRRGLLEQISDEAGLTALFAREQVSFYVGFDPTARSLHVGNFVPIMMMAHLQRAGHRPIAVVGGATGMIGDPSGRSSERNLLDDSAVLANLATIRTQLASFLRFEGANGAKVVNNADWTGPISYLHWLRDVGKYFSVNAMIAKESVRRRLEERDQGISYTEFSYMLLQAYDFFVLNRDEGVQLQMGGNDQWGNITAGIELIHKKGGGQAYAITSPLLLTAAGEKFGKSAGNAVWLDSALTSPFAFYQYWVRTDDRDAGKFLRMFTFLDLEEIEAIEAAHASNLAGRGAQKRLAQEVTRIVHGEAALLRAELATEILFGREIQGLSDTELADIFGDVPSTQLQRNRLEAGIDLISLLVEMGASASKGEARRALTAGSIYLNNVKVTDAALMVTAAQLASESTLVVRTGKKNYFLARFA
jgi:tyrosyl-tRNA synthetase